MFIFPSQQLNIGGSATLSLNSHISLKVTKKTLGDQSGELIARPSQRISFDIFSAYIPFSLHGRQRSVVKFPSITTCRGVGIKLSGSLSAMKNLTVSSGCSFRLENTLLRSFKIENVLVQRLGVLAAIHRDNVEMKVAGVTFSVHGGAKVKRLLTSINLYYPEESLFYRPKYWLLLIISINIFGFSFVVWRWFFCTLLSHTSTPVSRFRLIDLDPAAVLVPVAFFFFYTSITYI